ncbi:hypothetical protein CesoFtcFv8_006595 [Champsocephalus esox]|uniref:Reverse transcriptase RNase H-like domain-containing protein n=1 Tax=Champsocephalus esox TaxID=159716 RepID=A0AAN8CJR2_9TELE|nr:hypothetical protein CesoFtcFv8_006595 [Champsocephalus esox]
MTATHSVVPLGLLHARRIQRWLTGLRLDLKTQTTSGDHPPISREQPPILGVPRESAEGSSTGASDLLYHSLYRRFSDRMGGTCLERAVGGCWPLTEAQHSNLLELQAVMLVLQHFKPLIQGKHVLVRSDNHTTVAYINRQGGVRSIALLTAAENLWLWVSLIVLSLRALHIPGRETGGADLMSRGGPLLDEWRLHPEAVLDSVRESRGGPVRQSAQQPLCPVVLPGPGEAGAAVSHPSGPRSPPGAVVRGVTQMMVGQPWAIPQVWGALSQEAGAIGALPTLGQPLQAWLLRGTG